MQSPTVLDWNLRCRAQEACEAAGRPECAVRLVSGNGSLVLNFVDGTLHLSAEMGRLLTDEELNAMVAKTLRQGAVRHFLAQGGDPAAYVRAQLKIVQHMSPRLGPEEQRRLADALRVELSEIVSAGSLRWQQIDRMAADLKVPPKMYSYRPPWWEEASRYAKPFMKYGLYVLIALGCYWVAAAISRLWYGL